MYQGNRFNFDLRRDVNIKYIQDLACKLIKKDISNFHLLFNNKNLSDYPDTTLIQNIIKDDNNNIPIIITLKEKNNLIFSDNIKKLINKDLDLSKNSININNSKIMPNTPLISPINSQKRNKSINQFSNIIFNKKQKEYITKNKVFEEVYNLKENEILSLMTNLSQKIKEYDDILYNLFKNNTKCEISLYEKSIIDYKDKQIKFLKKLLNYFDTNEQNFGSGAISLTEFYKELRQYNNPKAIVLYNNTDCNKSNNINKSKKKLSKTDSKIKIDDINNKRNSNQNKKLPLLPNNARYFLSQNNNTISSVDSNENNCNLIKEKNLFKEHIFNSENKPCKNKKYITQNKKNVSNKKENKDKETNSNNYNNILISKKNINNNITDYKIKNNNFNKAISLCNTNDQTNTSQSTTMQGKVVITSIINNKNNSIKNILNKSSKNQINQKMITIINHKKDNKINAL